MAAVGVPIASSIGHGGGDKYAASGGNRTADQVGGTTDQVSSMRASEPSQTRRGINPSDLLKNPALARLIVAAAKKVKAEKAKTDEI